MGRGKKYQPEQVVNLLRQIEVAVANGKTTALACKEAGIVEQTYFRWRKEYGGLQVDQAKRLKECKRPVLAGCTWFSGAMMMFG
jgi:putative transposase